jgi:hypothetical protein
MFFSRIMFYEKRQCFAAFAYEKTADPIESAVIGDMFLQFLCSFAHESFRFYEQESVALALSAEQQRAQRESPVTHDF